MTASVMLSQLQPRNEEEFQLPLVTVDQETKAEKSSDAVCQKEADEDASEKSVARKNCVLASAFSRSGKYFAVSDDYKQLHVYQVTTTLDLLSSRFLARRCTALTFPSSEDHVIVADRTGDVYRYSLVDPHALGELLLGHLSMVLDVCMTADDKFIVTCDRDEKIRISCYPNCYNIHAFCLHHTEYVSQVIYLEDRNMIASASGDDRIAFWDTEGNFLFDSMQSCMMDHKGDQEPLGIKQMIYDPALNTIAATRYRSNTIWIFTFVDEALVFKEVYADHGLTGVASPEPWTVCFDDNHNLWILQACQERPVSVFKCLLTKESPDILIERGSNCSDIQDIVDRLNTKWDFFKGGLDCHTLTISLQKQRTPENMQEYLKKKEERINAQKSRQPPEKRLKTS
ncbi:tRNA (guanine-N(7)-)-methyltransferase non-catalytic subunit wdr4-like isoform X2 [Dreissena polymorpha]|uniref:tRNA (guanine-N(7)-)-methyltransferase non-catalytic subunit wdr4-like isoform X2 n=1 Tax=Dreissena polymorpha TaxID=45954 RepID=UPI0022656447|nr:tRNA (guanine-N(7)-)-methyltransferase non-catalytic subunit wdr4-like isoform X2 [Dreissena polymorpha]